MLASIFVGACWIGLVAGSAIYLHSIEKGPQQFDLYAGQQRFRIPWTYGPRGADHPNPNGITMHLCLNTLTGQYDSACRGNKLQQLSIYPPDSRFLGGIEELSRRKNPDRYKPMELQNGHEAYDASIQPDGNLAGIRRHYFRLIGPEGQLRRTVLCLQSGNCEHYAMFDRYVLFYNGPRSAFDQWDVVDRKMATLVDSWIVE